MVWGEQDGSWALGLSGVCTSMHAHRSTCTRVCVHTHTHTHTHTRDGGGDQEAGEAHTEGHTALPSPPWGRGDKYLRGF